MLTLSRGLGEKILIGENIEVVVVRIYGKYVQLGINAPPDVRIDREEIHLARKAGLPRKTSMRSPVGLAPRRLCSPRSLADGESERTR